MYGRRTRLVSRSLPRAHAHTERFPIYIFVAGYAIGSVEGRIGVEYFDPSQEAQDKKYAFKCHRQTIDDVDHVWPVNALAFHPVSVQLVDLVMTLMLNRFG